MGTMNDVIVAIRNDLYDLPGIRAVAESVPDSLHAYPAVVVYPVSMNWRLGSHSGDSGKPMRVGMYTIGIELVLARKDLARDVDTLMAFCDDLPHILFRGFKEDRYGGSAVVLGSPSLGQNATWPIRMSISSSSWGDDTTLAWRIELDVSVNEEINI